MNRRDKMARKVRAKCRTTTVYKGLRSQTTNAKSQSAEKVPKTPTNSQKPKTNQKPNRSPSIFEESLQSTYISLQYDQRPNTDSLEVHCSGMNEANRSPNLFETDPNESVNMESQVKSVSIGIQCTPKTQDVAIGTDDVSFKDSGIQCEPRTRDVAVGTDEPFMYCGIRSSASFHSSKIVYETDESDDEYDSLADEESSLSETSTSIDPFENFDMLEDLESPEFDTNIDDAQSTISDSPLRDQIYVNDRFHSPETLRLHLKKCSKKV